VGYGADQVRQTFGDGAELGITVEYSEEGEELRGTGGALKLAERFFEPRAIVLNGDTYLAADYQAVLHQHLQEHERGGVVASIVLAKLADARRFGTVTVDSSGCFVTGFREKEEIATPTVGWLNAGVYVIERELLRFVPLDTRCSLERDVFPAALAAGCPVNAIPNAHPFYDIGTPEDLYRFRLKYRELVRMSHPGVAYGL